MLFKTRGEILIKVAKASPLTQNNELDLFQEHYKSFNIPYTQSIPGRVIIVSG